MDNIRLQTNIQNGKQETKKINEQDQNADADKEEEAVVNRSTNDASILFAPLPHRSPGPSHNQPIPGGWPAKEHSDTETGHHGNTEIDGRRVQLTVRIIENICRSRETQKRKNDKPKGNKL